MADSKKYDGSQWEHSLRKLTTATEAVENPLYSDGTAITAYTIKGNTVQSGTPTPSNPVDVQGVGNKTANLYFKKIDSCAIAENGELQNSSNDNMWIAQITQGTSYTISALAYAGFFYNEPVKGSISYNNTRELIPSSNLTFTAPITGYVAVRYNKSNETPMINEGTTGLPYEPYGYKIPISSAQGLAVNYLGSVSSNRQISKYEFTGTEVITKLNTSADNYVYYYVTNGVAVGGLECTHLPYLSSGISTTVGISQNQTYPNTWYMNVGADIMNAQPSGNTAEGFKEWLSAQYSLGTPVTVWYIKQTATTGIVNEPLMNIGTYADSISNAVAIPTTDGANTITVDTTVQPSEFTATWTGWHDSSVKEWDGTNWQ